MKIPSKRQVTRAARGNTRTVPRRFRKRHERIDPRDAVNLNPRIHKAIADRLTVGLGKAERIERKRGGRP